MKLEELAKAAIIDNRSWKEIEQCKLKFEKAATPETILSLLGRLKAERRASMDRTYMIIALVSMLGPIATKVWEGWRAKGIERIHHDWAPDAASMTGEKRAAFLLDFEERLKTSTKVEFTERRNDALPKPRS